MCPRFRAVEMLEPVLQFSVMLATALLSVLYRSLKKGWEEPIDTSEPATA